MPPSALDGVERVPLMARATPRDPSRDNLAALRHEPAQPAHVLVVDEIDLSAQNLQTLRRRNGAASSVSGRRNGYVLLMRWGPRDCGPPTPLRTERRRRYRPGVITNPWTLPQAPERPVARPTLQATEELNALSNDLRRRPLLAVLPSNRASGSGPRRRI